LTKRGLCDACFSDEYPLPVGDEEAVPQLSLFRNVAEADEEASGSAQGRDRT